MARTIVLIVVALFGLKCVAQSRSEKLRTLRAELSEDDKLVFQCEQKAREYQIAKFGRVLPKVSGHCWSGCPTLIVQPSYPREARLLGISGRVRVETIVGENGNVVYAGALRGLPFLKQAAERAAPFARYTPKKACGDQPIRFRWTITYNFVLNRGLRR